MTGSSETTGTAGPTATTSAPTATSTTPATTTSTSMPTSKTSLSWELPNHAGGYFVTSTNRLLSDKNYFVWSVITRQVFEVCELTDIVDGVEPEPSPGDAREVWKKKNSVAKSFLLKSVSKDIILRIVHYEKVSEI